MRLQNMSRFIKFIWRHAPPPPEPEQCGTEDQKNFLARLITLEQLEVITPPCNVSSAGKEDSSGYISTVQGLTGHIMYGPYITLDEGIYRIRLTFEKENEYYFHGRVEISCGGKILAFKEIENAALSQEGYLDIFILLKTQVKNIEFLVLSYLNSTFRVSRNVSVQRVRLADIIPQITHAVLAFKYETYILDNIGILLEMLNKSTIKFSRAGDKLVAMTAIPDRNMRKEFSVYIKCKVNITSLAELVLSEIYNFYYPRKCIVIDIGANVGDSTLFFAANDNIVKVYAYEPFVKTFTDLQDNLSLNPHLQSKIIAYNYGLSSEDKKLLLNYEYEKSAYLSTEFGKVGNDEILVKNICTELESIYNFHRELPIIIKLDCEGSEFPIFNTLTSSNIFPRIKGILMETHRMGELHNFGIEEIRNVLSKNYFAFMDFRCGQSVGALYAFRV
jgi:FkbM family methyltransferase